MSKTTNKQTTNKQTTPTTEKQRLYNPSVKQQRTCDIDIQKLNRTDDNERTRYKASLSSEELVDRWFGKERLVHDRKAVNLQRAKNKGLPLLFNHNSDEPIGRIRNVKIDGDRLTGELIFGNSQRAREIEADVNEDLLDGVSIGYRVLKMEPDDDDETIFNVTKWELLEASIAPVPADNSIGVGRSGSTQDINTNNYFFYQDSDKPMIHEGSREALPVVDNVSGQFTNQVGYISTRQQEADTMPEENTPQPKKPDVNIQEIQDNARNAELNRIRQINSFGEKFNKRDDAKQFINDGKSVDDFREYLLSVINPNPEPLKQPSAEESSMEIGMTDREVKQFSFCRALQYLSEPNNPRIRELAAFEIECSQAAQEKRGEPSSGILVPNKRDWYIINKRDKKQVYPDMDMRSNNFVVPVDVLTRDLSAGTATDGAELVATNLLAGSFIDVLRNMLVVRAAGATILTDLVGDVAIPRKTSGSTGGWIATEGGDASQSDPQFDQVTLTPRTCGVYSEMTKQLIRQSSLDVEALVRTDLAVGLATTIDLAALYGSGASGQPTGISNTSGINTPTNFAGVNPTFAEVVDMETQVDVDNALMGSLSYILRADMKGALKTTEKATNTAQFVYESDNTMNGYAAWTTQQVTSGDLFFGNFRDLIIGMWGGLDMLVDPYTNSLSGTIRIVGHQMVDVGVRHPVSFSFNNDGA